MEVNTIADALCGAWSIGQRLPTEAFQEIDATQASLLFNAVLARNPRLAVELLIQVPAFHALRTTMMDHLHLLYMLVNTGVTSIIIGKILNDTVVAWLDECGECPTSDRYHTWQDDLPESVTSSGYKSSRVVPEMHPAREAHRLFTDRFNACPGANRAVLIALWRFVTTLATGQGRLCLRYSSERSQLQLSVSCSYKQIFLPACERVLSVLISWLTTVFTKGKPFQYQPDDERDLLGKILATLIKSPVLQLPTPDDVDRALWTAWKTLRPEWRDRVFSDNVIVSLEAYDSSLLEFARIALPTDERRALDSIDLRSMPCLLFMPAWVPMHPRLKLIYVHTYMNFDNDPPRRLLERADEIWLSEWTADYFGQEPERIASSPIFSHIRVSKVYIDSFHQAEDILSQLPPCVTDVEFINKFTMRILTPSPLSTTITSLTLYVGPETDTEKSLAVVGCFPGLTCLALTGGVRHNVSVMALMNMIAQLPATLETLDLRRFAYVIPEVINSIRVIRPTLNVTACEACLALEVHPHFTHRDRERLLIGYLYGQRDHYECYLTRRIAAKQPFFPAVSLENVYTNR